MGKWLAGAIALLVLVVLLWMQIRSPDPDPVVAEHAAAPAAAVPAVVPAAAKPAAQAAQAPQAAPEDELDLPERSGKIDPRSDEFFTRFDEVVPRELTRNAARCYEGRHGQLHRNQGLKLKYKIRIVNGQVTVRDVTVKESTLDDPALETCFIQEVARSTWKDDDLPDWEQDDELVLRPERGMKKYWRENVDYVGPEAPRM
ncbi:MAG TPA: hypothetical protein VF516_22615 [Kofleriaceae bacterium]